MKELEAHLSRGKNVLLISLESKTYPGTTREVLLHRFQESGER